MEVEVGHKEYIIQKEVPSAFLRERGGGEHFPCIMIFFFRGKCREIFSLCFFSVRRKGHFESPNNFSGYMVAE